MWPPLQLVVVELSKTRTCSRNTFVSSMLVELFTETISQKKRLNIQTLYMLFYIYCKRLPKLFYKLSSSSCDNFSTSSPITLLSLKFSSSCSISSKWLSGSIWSFVFDDLLRITGLSGGGGIPASPNSSSTSPRSPKIGSHPGNPPTL